jgi:hypothetical protein
VADPLEPVELADPVDPLEPVAPALLVVTELPDVLAWVDELLHPAAASETHSAAPTTRRRLVGSDRKDIIPPLTPKEKTRHGVPDVKLATIRKRQPIRVATLLAFLSIYFWP